MNQAPKPITFADVLVRTSLIVVTQNKHKLSDEELDKLEEAIKAEKKSRIHFIKI